MDISAIVATVFVLVNSLHALLGNFHVFFLSSADIFSKNYSKSFNQFGSRSGPIFTALFVLIRLVDYSDIGIVN